MFTRERHIVPPSGTTASPFGLAPYGSGSATQRPTCGCPLLRSAKDKSVVADAPPHKSVCCDVLLACARTKAACQLRSHKSVVYVVSHRCHAPFGVSAILSKGPQVTQITSALHTKALLMKFVRVRSQKSRTGFTQGRFL